MEASLAPPRSGRSRFSKALPTPPPGLDEQYLRKLPAVPPAPVPLRKDTVLMKSKSTTSLRTKVFDTPLPALPAMSIKRKPVGQLTSTVSTPAASGPTPKSKKRVSSISSILSAYSHSSTDSAQRSSHESDFTKDSEPSYSPERQDIEPSPPPVPTKAFGHSTKNGVSNGVTEAIESTIVDVFPPPPSCKDGIKPQTPKKGSDVAENKGEEGSGSQPRSGAGGSPSAVGREIWRRRASSKSDRSLPIIITELKLPGSNGATTATSLFPGAQVKADPAAPLPPPKTINSQTTTPLPPRTASLLGRNIRPVKPTEPAEEEDEMEKKLKLGKLRELLRSGSKEHNQASTEHPVSEKDTKSDDNKLSAKGLPSLPNDATKLDVAPTAPQNESTKPTSITRRAVGSQPGLAKKASEPSLKPLSLPHPSQRPSAGYRSDGQDPTKRQASQATREATRSFKNQPQSRQEPSMSLPQSAMSSIKPSVLLDQDVTYPPITDASSSSRKREENLSSLYLNAPPGYGGSDALSDVQEASETSLPLVSNDPDEPLSDDCVLAVSRFPHDQPAMIRPTANGIWPAPPLSGEHYSCYKNHYRFITVRNMHYSLSCQMCHVPDDRPRRVCDWCNLRICVQCHDLLVANGRDLRGTMGLLKGKAPASPESETTETT
ncbi:hypothetical protein F5Y18DRAFT_335468 [Xylariaceae sp. FL1019]|nr:hypothetical protein F5Y18DRAFT_335468 [Xylariaceae sp. FL1019]